MSKAIDELKDKFYKRPLDYGAFWPLIFPAILDLAARLDKLKERVKDLELASPCPMLKSICEDWEYTGKLDGTERIKNPIGQPKFGPVLNNAKPQPDSEIVERYHKRIYDAMLNAYDEFDAEPLDKILTDLINEVRKDKGESKEPPEFHDFCERVFEPGTDYRTGDIRMLLREHIKELREIMARWDAGV